MLTDILPLWAFFALLAVLTKTGFYAYQKKLLSTHSSLLLGYISSIAGTLFFVPIAIWDVTTHGLSLTSVEIAILLGIGVTELVAFSVYLRALQLTDISIASPLKRMKPMFVAVFEPLVFGIAFVPLIGVAATFAGIGGYIVLMKGTDLLTPFRRIRETGPKLAFIAALLYGVLSLGSRYGTTTTSPYVFGAIIFSIMTIGYITILAQQRQIPALRDHFTKGFAIIGVLGILRSLFVWIAYSMAAASLVVAVTQLTVLTDILVGGVLLKEDGLVKRILGGGMILAGVYIVLYLI